MYNVKKSTFAILEDKNMKRGFKLKFMAAVLLIGIVPALIASVILCFVGVSKLNSSLIDSTYEKLKVAAEDMNKYYKWDVEQDILEVEYSYVDSLKDEGIELTLFKEDVRYITSIVDKATGKRNEGTKADPKIYEIVKGGKDYSTSGVVIGGQKYYVYYTPLVLEDGTFWGMAFAGESQAAVEKQSQATLINMLVITAIAVIVCSGAVAAIGMYAKKSVVEVTKRTEELSNGILYEDINAASFIVEFDTLNTAANKLQSNLRNAIGTVNEKTTELNGSVNTIKEGVETSNQAASGIVSAVDELAKGSMDMAESVQNTASAMQNMGNGIESISELADTANATAKEVRTISAQAKNNLENLIEANKNTIEISQDVVIGINESSKAIEDIRKAADVIASIAGQTNLLSLNASIEAARAGEAGRGFAVVASSIQDLAAQSDASTKEIKAVIENIIAKSDANVELANQIKEAIDNEGAVLKDVDESFDAVNTKIEEAAEAIGSISEQTSVLNTDKATVLDEISTLSSISEENAASCEETTASMQELSANIETINMQAQNTKQVADDLTEAVAIFKLSK